VCNKLRSYRVNPFAYGRFSSMVSRGQGWHVECNYPNRCVGRTVGRRKARSLPGAPCVDGRVQPASRVTSKYEQAPKGARVPTGAHGCR
jgi:hypothetical protein